MKKKNFNENYTYDLRKKKREKFSLGLVFNEKIMTCFG